IYRILAEASGRPLRQIIRDTKRTDFYLDAARAREYGLIDDVLGPVRTADPLMALATAEPVTENVAASEASAQAGSAPDSPGST
nr:ATP-dependent Clp protease proteolytic subunit [Acidobacteriota bacterium]